MHATAVILLACGVRVEPAPRAEEDPVERPGAAEPEPIDAAYLDLFDRARIQEVRLRLSPEAEASLVAQPLVWVPATFEHDGNVLEDVGVRLKGSATFEPIDEKPSLKLKFSAYHPGLRYAGLERLTLNNLSGDPAQGREVVAYALWNDAGMSAPRASFAKVYLNGEYIGLYAALEPMDDAWLAKRYASAEGDLWEGNDSADLTEDGVGHFTLASGKGSGRVLADVATALAAPTDDFYALADATLDMQQFLDFWAWTMVTGNLDGYPYNLNDFYLYGDPAEDDRFQFSPWGMDETWDTGWHFQWGQGVVAFNCAADRACLAQVRARTEEALSVYETADAAGMAQAMFDLTEDAMTLDPRKPWTPAEVLAARTRLVALLEVWPERVRTSMWE